MATTNNIERKKHGNMSRASTVLYLSVLASMLSGSSAFAGVNTGVPNGRTIGMSRRSPTQSLRRSRSQLSGMTQLNYRHFDSKEEGVVAHAMRQQRSGNTDVDSSQPVWWNTLFARRHDEQEVVDEYLQFLNKRYHRLNDNDDEESQFSAFAWLKQGASVSQEKKENALHILGVAELASQKLLQKHSERKPYVESKMLRREAANKLSSSSTVVTVPSTVVEHSPAFVSKAVLTLLSTAQVIRERRQEILRFQGQKLGFVVDIFVNMLKVIPSAVGRLWSIGGGKRSIGVTLAAAAYLTLLLRPVFRAFVEA